MPRIHDRVSTRTLWSITLWTAVAGTLAAIVATCAAQGIPFALDPYGRGFGWSPLRLSPAAWYQAEDNALDSSGFGRHGTWVGTAAYTNGIVGRAFFGDGSSRVGTLTAHSGSFTLAMWINAPATQPGTNRRIAGKHSASVGWQIQVGSADNGIAGLRVDTSATFNQNQTIGVLFSGTPIHFVMTFDTVSGVVSNFTNGAFLNALTYSMGDGIDNANALTFLSNSSGQNPMVGAIDDALFWGRILTPAEVKELYDRSVAQQGAAWKVQ